MNDLISRQAAIETIDLLFRERYIIDTVITHYNHGVGDALAVIKNLPSAQPEIVRCKDCKYYAVYELKADGTDDKRYKPSVCIKGEFAKRRKPDWFCADGERRING